MKKMMYLLFVFSLLPVAVVSADDFIDNRLQVNNSRLETEQEKTLGGQLDATESLFNEKDQKKLADEKRKQEKQLTDSDGQLFSAIKGKKKTGPEADLFQPENQKLSKFESNVEDNSASLSDFIPALQMPFSLGLLAIFPIESIEKRPKWTNISMSPSV